MTKQTITANVYKTYSFKDKDPVIDQLRTMVQDSGMSYSEIQLKAGTSGNLLTSWFHGATRRPQSATIEAIGRAMGARRVWVDIKTGKRVKVK